MIIYIIGYGRSGSTFVSRVLEKRLNAVNLGEVKYLYRDEKNDLLSPFWLEFKKNDYILKNHPEELKKFDSFLGIFKWPQRKKYKIYWDNIFKNIGIDIDNDIIIDTSKTTLDSYMRGIYLYHAYDQVYFIKPNRSFLKIVASLLKGKNSSLERGNKKNIMSRLVHTILVGLPHYFITKLITRIYYKYPCYSININNYDEEIDRFIEGMGITPMNKEKSLPIIYGNRSRKKN